MCQEFGWEIYTCESFINTLKILISQTSEVFNKREKIGSDLHLKKVRNHSCFHWRESEKRPWMEGHCSACSIKCSHRRRGQQDAPRETAAQCQTGTGPPISDQTLAASYGSASTRLGPLLLGQPMLGPAHKAEGSGKGVHGGLLPLM